MHNYVQMVRVPVHTIHISPTSVISYKSVRDNSLTIHGCQSFFINSYAVQG